MSDSITFAEQLGHPKILVLGDAMLDRYTWGHAERVSPEAPVLVLRADEREIRLGGAASVAVLLRALEVDVTLATVVGDDHDGRTIRRLLDEATIDAGAMVVDPTRPTTTKERFLGHSVHRQPHQMLRVDTESRESLNDDVTGKLLNSLAALIPHHAALLISDYAKGVCTERLMDEVISLCQTSGVPVLVDPGRGVDFARYRGATLIKPNRLEAELAISHSIRSPDEALAAARQLQEQHKIEIVVITLDRDGLVYAAADESQYQPIASREICDITGAGDTVLATLGLGLAIKEAPLLPSPRPCEERARVRGFPPASAQQSSPDSKRSPLSNLPFADIAALANIAAGLQVARAGVAPILRSELLREFETSGPLAPPRGEPTTRIPPTRQTPRPTKLITLEQAKRIAAEYRQTGQTIVFTNGCFDLLHVGHINMLEESSRLGDALFVAINSDQSVRRLKGEKRPIISESDRASMLAALTCVHHVLIFDDDTPHRLLEGIRPHVLVKGGTTGHIVGREIVEGYGGTVKRTSTKGDWSTTRILSEINSDARSMVD